MLPTERPGQADNREWQLASLVVYCRPEDFQQARESLQEYLGTELHTDDGHAKLILTIEAESSRQLAKTMDAMRLVAGVMSLQMVYHQLDDPEDKSEEYSEPSFSIYSPSTDLKRQEAS